jgi:hypothetical protein
MLEEDEEEDEGHLSADDESLSEYGVTSGAREAKWWHVDDDRIEELVQKIAKENKEVPRESGLQGPKPIRRSHRPGRVSPKFTPQDALDQMLRRMTEPPPVYRPKESGKDSDYSEGEAYSKWWHISDEQLRDRIQELQEEDVERQPARSRNTTMRSTIGGSCSSLSNAPPVPAASGSPKGRKSMIHVRLRGLGRSEPMPCQRTGRRHPAAPFEDTIPVYFQMMDTGTRFSLNVNPEARIGPDHPPPLNRFTEKFGPGACTNGFDLKAQTFDYRHRRWATNSRPKWVPGWSHSLKTQIEIATGVEASKQRLWFHGSAIGSDEKTVHAAGIIPGVEILVYTRKSDSSRDLRSVTLACTAKRHERLVARQALRETSKQKLEAFLSSKASTMKASQGDSPKHLVMPPWKTQDQPSLFGRKDDGAGRDQSTLKPHVPAFEDVSIWRPDIEEQLLQRVRSLPCYTERAAQW